MQNFCALKHVRGAELDVDPRREMHLNDFFAEVTLCPAYVGFDLIRQAPQLSRHLKWHSSTSLPLRESRNHSQTQNVSSPTKMEGGMGVDLHKRDASRNCLLLTGQAIVPVLIILTTTVSCSIRAAELPEPPYRIVERILPF